MTPHPQPEALDLYLLNALDVAERAAVTAHLLTGCPACQSELAHARGRHAALAAAAPELTPPAYIRQRLLAQLEPAALTPRPRRPHWGWSWTFGPLAAALAALLIVGFLHQRTVQLQNQDLVSELRLSQSQTSAALAQSRLWRQAATLMAAPGTRAAEVKAGPAAPQGRAFLNPARGAVLIAFNLPPAPARHIYQLWLLPAHGTPQPAGVFNSGANDTAVQVYAQPVGDAAGLAVSIEPPGGSPQPTGAIVLAASLPKP